MKKKFDVVVSRTVAFFMAVLFFMANTQFVYADTKQSSSGSFAESKFATGTMKLISDITIWAMGASIAAIILAGIIYWLLKAFANEQEQSRWDKALKRVAFSAIGIGSTSSIINLILSYYK